MRVAPMVPGQVPTSVCRVASAKSVAMTVAAPPAVSASRALYVTTPECALKVDVLQPVMGWFAVTTVVAALVVYAPQEKFVKPAHVLSVLRIAIVRYAATMVAVEAAAHAASAKPVIVTVNARAVLLIAWVKNAVMMVVAAAVVNVHPISSVTR